MAGATAFNPQPTGARVLSMLGCGRAQGVPQDARKLCRAGGLGLLLLSLGCANVGRAERAALRSMKVIQVVAEDSIAAIDVARRERMAACDAEGVSTEQEALECLGPLAEPIAPKVGELRAAYDDAVDAIRAMADLVESLQRMKGGAAP